MPPCTKHVDSLLASLRILEEHTDLHCRAVRRQSLPAEARLESALRAFSRARKEIACEGSKRRTRSAVAVQITLGNTKPKALAGIEQKRAWKLGRTSGRPPDTPESAYY